ncbi:hypothetical protein LSH36_20g14009 [Paralvinella palmiformis]|uniref:Tetraspanin n=1 Tax=Paralvinella palmiformis TaxID=53620 RepID=A0AAD9KBC5_9ANNE|nr:hypothetical protein LSH36_20g14009 [Paralvinella palmiformis]
MYGNDTYRSPKRRPIGMFEEPSIDTARSGVIIDGCSQCLKYLLVLFNIIFLLAVLVMIGVSIYILITQSFLVEVLKNNYMLISCWLLILSGLITIALSFVGCFGAVKNHGCSLFAYAGVLFVMALSMAVGGVLALAMRDQIEEWKIAEMENDLKNIYGVNLDNKHNQIVTKSWDKAQEEMFCCGVRDQSWVMYRQSLWYAEQEGIETIDKPYVPLSCCKIDMYGQYIDVTKCQTFYEGPPATVSGQYNEALNYRGCYTAGRDWVRYYTGWLGGLGIGIACILLFGIAFSPWLAFRLKRRRHV